MDADSKVQGLLHCEQLALHHHLCHPHHSFTDVVNRHEPSKEEAPSPCFQEQNPLQGQASAEAGNKMPC